MTADYGGVVVEWTEGEAAKIAEIKSRTKRQPQSPTIAEDIKARARKLERDLSIILLRKTTGMKHEDIADLYAMPTATVETILRQARRGAYDYLGLWFCGNL
jgi:hypothetical protein